LSWIETKQKRSFPSELAAVPVYENISYETTLQYFQAAPTTFEPHICLLSTKWSECRAIPIPCCLLHRVEHIEDFMA
jgi:hypothetical protein